MRLYKIDLGEIGMALFINCPGCGSRIVNNGENCPFCGFNVKENKSAEEMEAERLENETASAEDTADKAAVADVQERPAQIQQTTPAQQNAPVQQSAPIQQTAPSLKKAAAEPPARTENVPQAVKNEQQSFGGNTDELPEIQSESGGRTLPPIEIERPVPLSKIANTPAVELTPIKSEELTSTLPPMQPEREITIEQIRKTPAVKLTPIEQEKVEGRLPDMKSSDISKAETSHSGVKINVEKVQTADRVSVERPQRQRSTEAAPTPAQPVQPTESKPKRQWSTEAAPTPAQPVQPTESKPKRQWSTETAPTPAQPVQPTESKPKRQWSTETAPTPAQPVQPTESKPKRQWSTEAAATPAQPVQPTESKPKRQWSTEAAATPAQPVQQRVDSNNAGQWSANSVGTSNQFENNKWTTSPKTEQPEDGDDFIENFKKNFEQNSRPPVDVDIPMNGPLNNNPSIQLQQTTANKKMPVAGIVVVAVLIIAIVVIVVLVMSGNGGEQQAQGSSSGSSVSASGSETKTSSGVSFKKPDSWGDKVYAYVYNSSGDENAKWPGVEMNNDGSGSYSYDVPKDIKDALIIFNDGDNQYPGKQKEGLKVTEGSSYSVEGTDIVVTFKKPDDWSDNIYLYVYQEGGSDKIADWPGEVMTKNSDGTYSYTIKSGTIQDARLIFNDDDGGNKYPKSDGLAAENGKVYQVE